ncbi:MAG: GNAT family N-acetyltransferase [Clostridia bacterium]|nr:GNAT family N-acetyltransferase [Clostridia bacterium]
MLSFRKIRIEDAEAVREIIKNARIDSCDFAFGNLFMWGEHYSLEVCIENGFLYCRSGKNGAYMYSFPIGSGDIQKALHKLLDFAGDDIEFYSLRERHIAYLQKEFPSKFEFFSFLDGREYAYKSENLIELAGRKYHQKRNHISKFMKTHTDVFLKEIDSKEDLDICRNIALSWFEDKFETVEEKPADYMPLEKALRYFYDLQYIGAILYADGQAVAFTIGEEISRDMFDVHFEKTLPEYKDAYPVINNQFVKQCLSKYKYINREDDTGSLALRKAKLSYNPDFLVNKYKAKVRKDSVRKTVLLKNLWKDIFGDDDKTVNSFFENVYKEDLCFSFEVDSIAAAALYLVEVQFVRKNTVYNGYYLYAAATDTQFQKRGMMAELIKEAAEFSSEKDFLILYPASEELYSYYKANGFDEVLTAIPALSEKNVFDNDYDLFLKENGYVYFSDKGVYNYLKTFRNKDSRIIFSDKNGCAMLFNDKLRESDIILFDNMN